MILKVDVNFSNGDHQLVNFIKGRDTQAVSVLQVGYANDDFI